MADQKLNIDIVTRQSGDGAKKTAEELGKLQEAGKAAGAEQEKAAGKAQSKWSSFGQSLRQLVNGDVSGAINSAGQLGASFAAWGAAIKAAMARMAEAARVLNEIKFDNLEAAAKSLEERFADVTAHIEAAKTAADSLAAVGDAVADAEASARTAQANADRARELSATEPGDEESRKRINAKYDLQVADIKAGRESARVASTREQRAIEQRKYEFWGGHESGLWEGAANLFLFRMPARRGNKALGNIERLTQRQGESIRGLGENELRRRELRQQLAVLDAGSPALEFRDLEIAATREGAGYSAGGLVKEADLMKSGREAAAQEQEAAARAAAAQGEINLVQARQQVSLWEGSYRSSPTIESARALKEAQASLKEMEKTFAELAKAVAQTSRETARHGKTSQADMGGG